MRAVYCLILSAAILFTSSCKDENPGDDDRIVPPGSATLSRVVPVSPDTR